MWRCRFWRLALRVLSAKFGRWSTDLSQQKLSNREKQISGSVTSHASSTTRRQFMPETQEMLHLKDLWDEQKARSMESNQLALLRYRSNLLGADLRITNFGGGNTSSKFELPDPFSGESVRV